MSLQYSLFDRAPCLHIARPKGSSDRPVAHCRGAGGQRQWRAADVHAGPAAGRRYPQQARPRAPPSLWAAGVPSSPLWRPSEPCFEEHRACQLSGAWWYTWSTADVDTYCRIQHTHVNSRRFCCLLFSYATPRTAQALAAGLAALALVADGLPVGWRTAAAAEGGASEVARLWLPLALDSLVRGARSLQSITVVKQVMCFTCLLSHRCCQATRETAESCCCRCLGEKWPAILHTMFPD